MLGEILKQGNDPKDVVEVNCLRRLLRRRDTDSTSSPLNQAPRVRFADSARALHELGRGSAIGAADQTDQNAERAKALLRVWAGSKWNLACHWALRRQGI